jgi:methionine synthase II (cobalamin-independent)
VSTDPLTTDPRIARSIAAQVAQGAPERPAYPWAPGSATGVGSMPGTDPAQVCAVVIGELPDFPFLPELPGRGVGADMIGRTAALLVDMPVETTAGGWRLAGRPGRDQRHADSFLAFDLDAAQQAADGYRGPYKISVCGPLTLAASIELTRSLNPALADPGALADLVNSLAEGLAQHVAGLRERIPGADIVVQLDEPSLPWVLAGRIPTASALNTIRALDETAARDALGPVLAATTASTVVHCCASDYPFLLVKDSGANAVSFDLATVGRANLDALAEVADAGLGLLAGVLPTDAAPGERPRAPRDTAAAAVTLWRRMTLAPQRLAEQVVLTPACGLAGLSPQAARAALAHCREAARIAPELIEEAG